MGGAAKGFDVSMLLNTDGFQKTMDTISKELEEDRKQQVSQSERRRKARNHDTTTYDDDASENHLQKLRRRWAYLANHET